MARQRIILAKIGGAAVADRFRRWLASCHREAFPASVGREVDQFAPALRANAATPPVIYFCERG
jgi:hypothetical protein